MAKNIEVSNSGVVITFDMHPGLSNQSPAHWQNKGLFYNGDLLDMLESQNVKATFMISNFLWVYYSPEWITLIDRIVERHEIGGHTLKHTAWNPNIGAWNYYVNEFYYNLWWYQKIRQDHGKSKWPDHLKSFAYPYTIGGEEIDKLLLTYYSHLRGNTPNVSKRGPLSAQEVRETGIIGGGWLDRSSFLPNPDYPDFNWEIVWRQWLDTASNEREYVVYGSHMPSWDAGGDPLNPEWADPVRILEFVNYVNNGTGLPFVTMGELPSNFPKPMTAANESQQVDIDRLAELTSLSA